MLRLDILFGFILLAMGGLVASASTSGDTGEARNTSIIIKWKTGKPRQERFECFFLPVNYPMMASTNC